MSTARLELVVDSSGVRSADKDLKQLTATAKETEKQQKRMADVFAEVAAAETREAAKAIAAAEKKAAAEEKAAQRAAEAAERQVQRAAAAAEKQAAATARQLARENEQWNDAKQKAIARYEKQAEAAEKAAARQVAAAERVAARENEQWERAIQRAKAGLDGVLPIRPSLQRIEARLNESPAGGAGSMSGILAGGKQGALNALGMGALAGGAAAVAATAVSTVIEKVKGLTNAVVENMVEDENLIARLGGVTDSAEQASETFEDLEKRTLGKLPSTVNEVANAFIQLGNNGLQNGQSQLKAYSNIAAQTGNSLTSVTSAVQQATMGNYRSLREYGIKVKEVGDDLQITFRGQTDTIGNSSEAIESYMQRLGTVEFAGAVERQMDNIGGTVKKTHDAWERFINTVADSSIGSLIQSSIGASIGVIDAMTASVDALFGKTEKGLRNLEAEKKRLAEQDALDKTMMSWADPTVSKSEASRLADQIETHRLSTADKTLSVFSRQMALIEKMRSIGETQLPNGMSLEDAENELTRQFRRDNGGDKTRTDGYTPKIAEGKQTNFAAFTEMMRKQEYEQLLVVRESLTKQEDAERASYEKRREFLAQYTGPDSEELWQKNSELWSKHLDEVAAKSAKAQLELQQKLQGIGGPQSQTQAINNKFAGQHFELESALADNLSGKNGDELRIAAEQLYAEKSVAIERARIAEIEALNRQLVGQSVQNAELMFGGLAAAMKNAHGEQSKEYRIMFAMQKAFGIASAEVAMYQSMAEASKQPFPANVPLYIKAAAQGAQIIAQISSLSYSGAMDGGGDIPAGSFALVAERRPEILTRPSFVRGPASVVGGEATANLLGGSRQSEPRSTRWITVVGAEDAFKGWLGSTPFEDAVVNVLKNNGPLVRSVR